jgi:hypothetical protein
MAPTLDQRLVRLQQRIQDGRINQGLEEFEGGKLAPPTWSTWRMLHKDRFTHGAQAIPTGLRHLANTVASTTDVDPNAFLRSISSSHPQAATGPSGLADAHLQWMLQIHGAIPDLLAAAHTYASNQLPPEVAAWSNFRYYTALEVREGKVRGITPGDRLAHHTGAALLRAEPELLLDRLQPFHAGLCLPARADLMPMLAKAMLVPGGPWRDTQVYLGIDFAAAYDQLS